MGETLQFDENYMNLSEMQGAYVHFNTIKSKCVCALFNRLATKNDQMIQNTNIKYEQMRRLYNIY